MSELPTPAPQDRYADRRELFAHQPPAGYADEVAQELARLPFEEVGFTATMLVFRVAALTLAIPPAALAAVSRAQHAYPLPHRRSGPVLGLVVHRGEVIPCCSLVRLMGVADSTGTGAQARTLILTDDQGKQWAIPVDDVLGISTGAVRMDGPDEQAEWTNGTFVDSHGTSVQTLRLDYLTERMRQAIA